jgi:RNase P/RNase MRP subunit POP5
MTLTLKRRYKRRYILVLSTLSEVELVSIAKERVVEMFGYIADRKACLNVISDVGPDLHVIRCKCEYLGDVLSAITLINREHSIVVLDISGTLRSLRRRASLRKNLLEKLYEDFKA